MQMQKQRQMRKRIQKRGRDARLSVRQARATEGKGLAVAGLGGQTQALRWNDRLTIEAESKSPARRRRYGVEALVAAAGGGC